MALKKPAAGFVVIWEFCVRSGQTIEFETVYGPEGDWAQFFRKSHDYTQTELVRDLSRSSRYLTMDAWTSQNAYEEFRRQHAAEYEKIDEQCSNMTERETEIGRFQPVF